MLFAGSIGLLFGFFSFEFIPYYWDPNVLGHFIASPEDLIFSFATGVLAWALATWQLSSNLLSGFCLKQATLRAVLFALPGIGIAYAFGLTIMSHMPMQTTFIGAGVMGLVFFIFATEILAGCSGRWAGFRCFVLCGAQNFVCSIPAFSLFLDSKLTTSI